MGFSSLISEIKLATTPPQNPLILNELTLAHALSLRGRGIVSDD
jgi:hypothetical protein